MTELLGKSLPELQEVVTAGGFPKFRAKQVMDYLYKRYIFDFEAMLQLPAPMRQWLSENCTVSLPKIVTDRKSTRLNSSHT